MFSARQNFACGMDLHVFFSLIKRINNEKCRTWSSIVISVLRTFSVVHFSDSVSPANIVVSISTLTYDELKLIL